MENAGAAARTRVVAAAGKAAGGAAAEVLVAASAGAEVASAADADAVAFAEDSAGNRLRPDTLALSVLHSSRISTPAVHPRKPCYPSLFSHDSR